MEPYPAARSLRMTRAPPEFTDTPALVKLLCNRCAGVATLMRPAGVRLIL